MPNVTSTPLPARRISDRLFVSAQPRPSDVIDLARRGFGGLISNRPGREEPNQPDPADERRAAEAAGMLFRFIPVSATAITEADVRAFQEAVAAMPGKVFAHCRSGIRSANLHAIGEALDGHLDPATLPALGAEWGVDLSIAARWLASDAVRRPRVTGFFDPQTFSIQYVVSDPVTRRCAIVDPVLDFDRRPASSRREARTPSSITSRAKT